MEGYSDPRGPFLPDGGGSGGGERAGRRVLLAQRVQEGGDDLGVELAAGAAAQLRLADLALTRVAAEGSMIVNSSRGGGAKDTWIVGG